MKINFLYTICMLVSASTYGQQEEYDFLGALAVKDAGTYSYKLHFTVNDGKINGYSITDVNGKDETKSAITGNVNSSGREMRFHETKLIYTKSASNKNDFCFVHTKLKMAERRGTHMLKGSFRGYKQDGKTDCAKGHITMIASKDLLNRLMKVVDTLDTAKKAELKKKLETLMQPKDTASEKKEVVKKIPAYPDIIFLSPGDTFKLPVKTRNIQLEIWDHEKIDGDIITLKLDDKVILDHYSLVAEHKYINLSLSTNVSSTLLLSANGEGAEPPNTVRMIVHDGDMKYQVQASTTLSKDVKIEFKNDR